MPIVTALTQSFDLEYPIILAPMANFSGGALAATVSRAGGLGLIGGGYGDGDWLKRELQLAGNENIGIGFITWSLAKQPELLDLALDHKPRAMFLSFGDLKPFAGKIAAAGVPLIAQVQSVADAKIAASEGAQFIVAQGSEAGGHGGGRGTLPLVPAVIDAVGKTPVIAAGGIADGRGLAAALALGAAGVVCGTAFYASREALTNERIKAAAVAASGDNTVRSSIFDIARRIDWPGRWTIRTLDNAFHREWAEKPEALEADSAVQAQRYKDAAAAGDADVAAVIVGEAIDLVHEIRPAAEIVRSIGQDAERRIAALARTLIR